LRDERLAEAEVPAQRVDHAFARELRAVETAPCPREARAAEEQQQLARAVATGVEALVEGAALTRALVAVEVEGVVGCWSPFASSCDEVGAGCPYSMRLTVATRV